MPYLFLILFGLFSATAFAQDDYLTTLPDVESFDGWDLQLERDGIEIYTRDWPGSDFVAVKTVQVIQSSLSSITGNLLHVESYPEWVRDMKDAKVIKGLDANNKRIVYMQMGLPWPMQDRDVVIGQKLSQNSDSLVVHIQEWNEGQTLPEKKGIIRIPRVNSEFVLVPQKSGGVKMIWQGHNEPGGFIPSFFVNWMIENIFYDSSMNMRKRFENPEFTKVANGIINVE